MRRILPEIPYGQEDFLYFVLSCNDSVESVVNRSRDRLPSLFFSSIALADWTISNWEWAVSGVVTCSTHINVMYSHPRILNHKLSDVSHLSIAHFSNDLPIYNYYKQHYSTL